jgi:pyruvate kinase
MSSDDVNRPGIGRTKIVATIGPASSTPELLRHLIEAGVSVFRLNFSHGTHEGHSAVVSHIRTVSREVGRQVGILQDLCGPKMRLGFLPADVIDCRLGDEYALVSQPSRQGTQELTCSYQRLPDDLKPGETVLLADGTVTMIVVDTAPGRARLKVTLAGASARGKA